MCYAENASQPRYRTCFQSIPAQNIPVLWLTPLFPVDYTRLIGRSKPAHTAWEVDHFKGLRPAWFFGTAWEWATENTRGRLGHDKPPGSVERVSLQERIDRWVSRGLAWLMRKLLAQGPGKSRARPCTPPAGDSLRDSLAPRSVVRHVRLTGDFFSLGAIGPGVALLFGRVSRAVPTLLAARGKCIVARLKERNVHGHGGENRSPNPSLSFRGWRRAKT